MSNDASISSLEAMTPPSGLGAQLARSVAQAPLQTQPFEHIYMENVFTPVFYREMLANMPDTRSFHELRHKDALRPDGTSTRLRLWLWPELLRRLPLVKEAEDTSVMTLLREAGSPWVGPMQQGVEVSSLAIQLALVAAGVGASILSALGASHPVARGLLFVPLRPAIERHVQLLQRRDRALRPAAQALADCLVEALTEAPLHPRVRVARFGR